MDISFPEHIIKGTFSIPKENNEFSKAKFQLTEIKNELYYQFSMFKNQKVYHLNIPESQISSKLTELITNQFNALELQTADSTYGYKISKKGKLLTNKRQTQNQFLELTHNKKKKYLLEEGVVVPPLVDLGVMTPEGMIVKSKYDKYRQINRFLEMLEDCISKETYLKIIDFGCGKSYLTFLIYYYLTYVKKIDCDIIGLDLKAEVVEHCNQIARRYNYEHLHFYNGDISKFKEEDHVDLIVTLHACDTATDYALYHAIKMKSRYIFSVPCCQHEINLQLKSNQMHLISKYGILKERMSAIITDAIRANILQYYGYKTQVLEFIDMDLSPKNLLIRATYEGFKPNQQIKAEVEKLINELGVKQTLYHLTLEEEKGL